MAFHILIGFSNSQNAGRKLENVIFMELRRKYAGLFSFKGTGECEFIVTDPGAACFV